METRTAKVSLFGLRRPLPSPGFSIVDFLLSSSGSRPKLAVTYDKTTGIGTNLTPDVEDAVQKLRETGYNNVSDPTRLAGLEVDRGESRRLGEVLEEVEKNLNRARDKDASGAEWERMRQCMYSALDGRNAEQSAGMIEAFEAEAANKPYTLNIEYHQIPMAYNSKVSYRGIDFDRMLRSTTTNPEDRLKALRKFVSGFEQKYTAKDNDGKRHRAAITSTQRMLDMLNGICGPSS
ncbi:hypothetical protein BDV59DRAFT_206056 [Aspergillus ambiguus]|uniref:uncharacterized protein n=1 Tax=Aspergillus ambiguus TaxID=176160 RepID=UPI003CCE065B